MSRKEKAGQGESDSSPLGVAERLRREIMALPDGTRLGIESDLLARLNTSRPTFREAARLLQSEQILAIRSGLHGGYFTRRPNISAIGRGVATFLEFEKAKLVGLMNAANALMTEAGRLAAQDRDANRRKRFSASVERLRRSEGAHVDQYFSALGGFIMAMLEMADNPAIMLFTRMLHNYGFSEASYYLWRSKFGGMSVSDAKRLKELETEKSRLKKLLAESLLENEVTREALRRKW